MLQFLWTILTLYSTFFFTFLSIIILKYKKEILEENKKDFENNNANTLLTELDLKKLSYLLGLIGFFIIQNFITETKIYNEIIHFSLF